MNLEGSEQAREARLDYQPGLSMKRGEYPVRLEQVHDGASYLIGVEPYCLGATGMMESPPMAGPLPSSHVRDLI